MMHLHPAIRRFSLPFSIIASVLILITPGELSSQDILEIEPPLSRLYGVGRSGFQWPLRERGRVARRTMDGVQPG